LDPYFVVFHFAVGGRTIGTKTPCRADAEPCKRLPDNRRGRNGKGYRVNPVRKESVKYLLCRLPCLVAIEVNPALNHAATSADLNGRRSGHALNQRGDQDPVLIVAAVHVIAESMGLRLAIPLGIWLIARVAQPRAADLVLRPVMDHQCRVTGRCRAIGRISPIIRGLALARRARLEERIDFSRREDAVEDLQFVYGDLAEAGLEKGVQAAAANP
jgi:hypothetical protein